MDSKPRILIVDDDPSARDTLEALLFREGYELLFATNAYEVLADLTTLLPDVILLDVMMPGMTGFELCQELKGEGSQWRHIPIILVTALDSTDDLVTGLDSGADEFISKPVNKIELRARVRSMLRIKRQYDNLQLSLNMREDLSQMITHDMRTPLALILIYGELILRKGVPDTVREDLAIIQSQTQKLDKFVNDILMLARMEQGKLALTAQPIDVNEMIYGFVDEYRLVAESKQVRVACYLPKVSEELILDRSLILRVLDNLVSNAVKFSPAGSTVTITAIYKKGINGSSMQLQVIDEGPGIAEEKRERIFDKFEIVNLRQEGMSQVGLGLAFCKMVVDAHKGRIFVEPNQPNGSRFIVEL